MLVEGQFELSKRLEAFNVDFANVQATTLFIVIDFRSICPITDREDFVDCYDTSIELPPTAFRTEMRPGIRSANSGMCETMPTSRSEEPKVSMP